MERNEIEEMLALVWVPMFAFPWVVGVFAIVAIVGSWLYRVFQSIM